MNTHFHRALLPLVVLALSVFSCGVSIHSAEAPPNIIFDTDMGGDCDDVGALFMLHGAIERGDVKLLATMGCTSSEVIAPAIDAINTWFGRPEIPVGTLKDPGFHADPGILRSSSSVTRTSSRPERNIPMRSFSIARS